MKCDTCTFKRMYITGGDEYPANTAITYCKKEHWENGPEPDDHNEDDPWKDCKDYKEVTT